MRNEIPKAGAGSGVTERLANLVASIRFDDLPQEAVDVGKAAILDAIGNTLAGSTQPLGQILIDFVRSNGGNPQATVVGAGLKTSAPMAAFANAAFCHSMDYEPVFTKPPTHAGSPLLPALLALAEREGIGGRDLLVAFVVGVEVQARINLAALGSHHRGFWFHPPGTLGAMGSAVACARLLGLEPLPLRRAVGIAGSRAGGLLANTGTMTKSQHSANSARAGVEAALLARAGYTANESIFEVSGGYVETLYGEGFDLEAILRDFGAPFRAVDPGLAFKFYPSQFPTHWPIEAALEIRRRYQPKPGQIARVVARVGMPNFPKATEKPETGLEGKFSLPYTVAIALLDGKVIINSFTDERRFAADVVDLMERISVVVDPAIPHTLDPTGTWAEVSVTLEDGRTLTERCMVPRGRPDRPLTRDERLSKFHDCASRRLSHADATRVVDLVERLDTLKDLSELMGVLSGDREPSASCLH